LEIQSVDKNMKITSIETTLLQIPYSIGGGPIVIAGRPAKGVNILLVKVETDSGLVGWGEAFGHSVAPATKHVLDTLVASVFIGRDPTDITALMKQAQQNLLGFGRSGPVMYALSGIDIALWDIAGKRANLPLHQLLGGCRRTEIPVYASLMRYGEEVTLIANCRRALAQGYRTVKVHEIIPALAAAARATVGPDIPLMMDANCPWTVSEARAMARTLRPLNLTWLEEPVFPPDDHRGLAAVRAEGVPIAAGENAGGGLHDFRRMFEAGAIDVAQPSVTKVGGITEVRKIVALAEAFGVRLVPHCAYFGPGYLAAVHIAATLADPAPLERLFMDLETSPFSPYTEAAGGKVPVPQSPGLGCDPSPELIERYRTHPPTVVR
jgi:D-galactarolactone cycloisomerase